MRIALALALAALVLAAPTADAKPKPCSRKGSSTIVSTKSVRVYRVKNEALQDLTQDAGRLARRFRRVEYRAVRRELNELADRLVNEALDGTS